MSELYKDYDYKYYIYFHVDPVTDEVVYVGRGSKGRAWDCRVTGSRKKDHVDYLEDLIMAGFTPDDWVSIVAKGHNEEESKNLEMQYIDALRPKYNKNYDYALVLFNEEDFKRALRLRNKGLSYSKIAEEMGCCTMTAHRALTGKTKAYFKYE